MARQAIKGPPLHELLTYEPDTGLIRWKVRRGPRKAGQVTGCPDTCGYLQIGVNGMLHLAHRVAWYLHYGNWPSREIDHINGDPRDNRIANLRLATRAQNQMNAGLRSDNTSGIRGVAQTENGKWRAKINVGGHHLHLGTFDTKELAHRAYQVASETHFGIRAGQSTNRSRLNNAPRTARYRRQKMEAVLVAIRKAISEIPPT
jgi:hypothetical protein